jgi:hypothetical protein
MKVLAKYFLIVNLFFLSFNLIILFQTYPDKKLDFCENSQCYSEYLTRDIEYFFKSDRTVTEVLSRFGAPTNSTNHNDKLMLVFLLPPNVTINFPENSVVGFSVLSDSNGVILSWSYSRIGNIMESPSTVTK